MKEAWLIQVENGEQKILTNINLVSKFETELRNQELKYKTDYYQNNKCVFKSNRKI